MKRWLWFAAVLAVSTVCAQGWPTPSDSEPAALTADQAFQLLPPRHHDGTVELEWAIAPGYFLYRDRIHVDGATTLSLPTAQTVDEPGAGAVQAYRDDLRVSARLKAGAHEVTVRYQGCSDRGICYPPQSRTFKLKDS